MELYLLQVMCPDAVSPELAEFPFKMTVIHTTGLHEQCCDINVVSVTVPSFLRDEDKPLLRIVSGILNIKPQVKSLRKLQRRLYMLRLCRINNIRRVVPNRAPFSSSIWITTHTRPIWINGKAAAICPGQVANAGWVSSMEC